MGMLDYKPEEWKEMDGPTKLTLSFVSLIAVIIAFGFLGGEAILFLLMALIAIHNAFALTVGLVIGYGIVYAVCGVIGIKIGNAIKAKGEANSKGLKLVYEAWKLLADAALIIIAVGVAYLAWPLNPGATALLVLLYLFSFGAGMLISRLLTKLLDNIIDDSRKERKELN